MKLKLINSGCFVFFITLFIILQGCGGQTARFILFDNEIALSSRITKHAHDQPFLDLIKLEKLNYNLGSDLKSDEMYKVASAALSKTQTELKAEDVKLLFVFTTSEDGSVGEITVEDSHAFSAFSYVNDQLEHYYFEKQSSETFVEISSLRTTLSAGFSNDDIRMLHFAAIGKNGLPAQSTIYEFNMESDPNRPSPQEVDFSIRMALLLDNDRYWGASTCGLYGEEIQAALMAPQSPGGGNFCGFVNPGPPLGTEPTDPDTGCPVGADPCYNDPVAGTKKYCTKKDKGGCFAATATLLKETGQFPDLSVDFRKLWDFQDEFLLKYDIGRDYVASYILFSLFAEPNNESLEIAAIALPLLYQAIDIIISNKLEDTDEIVVTPELFQVSMDLLESVRQIEDRIFQNMLNRLENDLREFQGLTKKEFINIFETQASVSLKNPSIP